MKKRFRPMVIVTAAFKTTILGAPYERKWIHAHFYLPDEHSSGGVGFRFYFLAVNVRWWLRQ